MLFCKDTRKDKYFLWEILFIYSVGILELFWRFWIKNGVGKFIIIIFFFLKKFQVHHQEGHKNQNQKNGQ